jgi:hypothetical protein
MTELIPRLSNRPAVLTRDGWAVYVSVHDAWFLAEWRRQKQRLAEAHPDKGGSSWRYRTATGRVNRWLQQEQVFYRQLGLEPPRWGER